jgi:hypothetical protein
VEKNGLLLYSHSPPWRKHSQGHPALPFSADLQLTTEKLWSVFVDTTDTSFDSRGVLPSHRPSLFPPTAHSNVRRRKGARASTSLILGVPGVNRLAVKQLALASKVHSSLGCSTSCSLESHRLRCVRRQRRRACLQLSQLEN